ncbi:MAG: YigZ family protein [Bilophila sp.]
MNYPIPDLAPDALHSYEESIKRSRFIVSLAHTPDTRAAKAFVERIKCAFPDATHNCWAFVAGPPGQTGQVGYSDDGEPHGTAGRPMLTMLLHSGTGELCAVVTRYFGGIKLGTGGLVRAYQGMVRQGLETLPVREHMSPARLEVVLDYAHITPFLRLLPAFRASVAAENFGVDATYQLLLPDENCAALEKALTECTDGAVLLTRLVE